MRVFSERQPPIALATLAFVVLNNALASTMFLAVYDFDIAAFGGLGFVLVGSIGAVLWASVGPPLLEASAAGSASALGARVAFGALSTAVYVGLWGTLEQLLLGGWLIGVGWLVRAEGRAFAGL